MYERQLYFMPSPFADEADVVRSQGQKKKRPPLQRYSSCCTHIYKGIGGLLLYRWRPGDGARPCARNEEKKRRRRRRKTSSKTSFIQKSGPGQLFFDCCSAARGEEAKQGFLAVAALRATKKGRRRRVENNKRRHRKQGFKALHWA